MENLKTYIISITSVTKKNYWPCVERKPNSRKNIAGRKRLRNDSGIRKWGCLSQCNQCDQGFKWKNNSNKWLYKEIFIENSNYFEETKCKVDSCNIWCPKCKPNDCLILSKQIKKETNNPPKNKQKTTQQTVPTKKWLTSEERVQDTVVEEALPILLLMDAFPEDGGAFPLAAP